MHIKRESEACLGCLIQHHFIFETNTHDVNSRRLSRHVLMDTNELMRSCIRRGWYLPMSCVGLVYTILDLSTVTGKIQDNEARLPNRVYASIFISCSMISPVLMVWIWRVVQHAKLFFLGVWRQLKYKSVIFRIQTTLNSYFIWKGELEYLLYRSCLFVQVKRCVLP